MKNKTQNPVSKLKIFGLFVLTLMASSLFANNGSSLRLLLPNTGEHTVFIDNVPYKGVYDKFRVDQLRPGNHRIKIVELVISPRGRVLDKFVLYNGMVFIPKNAKIWAKVNRNGRLQIERTYQRESNRGYYDGNRGNERRENNNRRYDYDDYYDEDWYGYNDGSYDRNERDNYAQRDNNSQRDEYSRGQNEQRDNRDSRYSNNSNRSNEQHLALTISAINKQAFDTERLKIAKNAVAQGSMSSKEIAEITKLFSFESSRLEFAKYAYDYTTDKINYVVVQDAFQFSSSVSELQDYITQKGNR